MLERNLGYVLTATIHGPPGPRASLGSSYKASR